MLVFYNETDLILADSLFDLNLGEKNGTQLSAI